jgi:heme-degrading monooxygenase HmoA
MVIEAVIMTIKTDRLAAFEAAMPKAAEVSASTPGYISHEILRCVETPGRYIYIIRWESIDAHLINYRQSPRRDQFRKIIEEFLDKPNFAEHYEAVTADRI